MILVIHILISVWIITIQATEKYSAAMYYIRYGGSTLLYTAYTVYTVYTVQTAVHCSNSSMFAYIYIYILLGEVLDPIKRS